MEQKSRSHLDYIRELKHLLPEKAFEPDPKKLFYLIGYTLILIVAYFLFRISNHIIIYIVLTFAIGHCLACIGFISHELSHNSIIISKKFKYPIEVFSWGLNLIPATLWIRVHNHTHHTQANTPNDPDRQFFITEKASVTNWYTKIFYPNRKAMKWNPMVAFHFIPYILRNVVAVFYRTKSKPKIVPSKPNYTAGQKAKIIAEIVTIIIIQLAIYFIVGRNWLAYLFASPIALLLTSSILMSYIFTNHFINQITETPDPLCGTTSVKVPKFVNKIHFNFAFHSEHHLFPSMNSEFYPQLSSLLKEKYPNNYNYIPITKAWQKLWENNDFLPSPNDSLQKSPIK